MKKTILAACIAASLWGCDAPTQTAPAVIEKPVGTKKLAVAPGVSDAGSFVAAKPHELAPPQKQDGLGVAHEQPEVDHLMRAHALRETGDLSGALTEARRAVYSSPTDEEALRFIARVAPITGQHTLAADAWAAISEVRPDDATPRIQEARSRLRAKDAVGATVAAMDAIARDPGVPEAHHVHGRAALSRGELQEAIDAFEKAVALDGDHGHALNNLGFAYLRANENAAAVQVLARAAALLPNVAYVQNNLGIALERVGRTEEARAAYSAATSLSPKYIKARVNMNRVAKVAIPVEATDTTVEGTMGEE
jgi:Flp pilus assembly protein TadD